MKKTIINTIFATTFIINTTLATAAIEEPTAKIIAQEIQTSLTAAAGVIGDLQKDINSGKVDKSLITPDAIATAVSKRYEKIANKPFDTSSNDSISNTRKVLIDSIKETIGKFQPQIQKGGEDVFVPAFFRAQVLKRFNSSSLADNIRVYATNKDNQLINSDWAVKTQMKGSPLISEVENLMKSGGLDPVQKKISDRYLGYWPMKLGAPCVSCHARNGLTQTEGGFGGALVVDIKLK